MPILFAICLLLSAGLLFIVQPMVAKSLLPVYGGTPSVWTICMLFFQAMLLLSYGYAWVLSRLQGVWRWRMIHLAVCLFSLGVVPLIFAPHSGPGMPEFTILKELFVQCGLPLLMVASTAPLLQYAFSQSTYKHSNDPYFLYVASNAGSLVALLGYPFVVERFSGLVWQFRSWNMGYLVYLILLGVILMASQKRTISKENHVLLKLHWPVLLFWVLVSALPCSLMMGVTSFISTDLAAMPLLWVSPLALYLLTFMIAFAKKPLLPHRVVSQFAVYFVPIALLMLVLDVNLLPMWLFLMVNLSAFFTLALFCHGELVRTRPGVQQLTTFYFCLALGGVFAGVFNGLLAPKIFNRAYEYPLVLCLIGLIIFYHYSRRVFWILAVLAGLVFFLIAMIWQHPKHILSQQRNFYGIKQVFKQNHAHILMSQNTMHGFQLMNNKATIQNGSFSYYAAIYPIVQYFEQFQAPLRVMVIGLGTGHLACQFQKNDHLDFVEIDEQVIAIAKNPNWFTYLQDCPPHTHVIKEDGRTAVKSVKNGAYALIIIDAFNSDAIPVHLLTQEAFALYKQKINGDGAILIHISNRHVSILPVITSIARQLDMILLFKQQRGEAHLGQLAAEWAVLTINDKMAGHLLRIPGWRFVTEPSKVLWTDDYTNIIPLLK